MAIKWITLTYTCELGEDNTARTQTKEDLQNLFVTLTVNKKLAGFDEDTLSQEPADSTLSGGLTALKM